MSTWLAFLASLETEGGRTFLTLFAILFFCIAALVMLLTGHVPKEAGRELMTAAIFTLLGIFYEKLRMPKIPPSGSNKE